jgi:hypothetical protein
VSAAAVAAVVGVDEHTAERVPELGTREPANRRSAPHLSRDRQTPAERLRVWGFTTDALGSSGRRVKGEMSNLEFHIAVTRVVTAIAEPLTPDQRREVASKLRGFEGDRHETEFYGSTADALEQFAADSEAGR